jgi:hypothetical protein
VLFAASGSGGVSVSGSTVSDIRLVTLGGRLPRGR